MGSVSGETCEGTLLKKAALFLLLVFLAGSPVRPADARQAAPALTGRVVDNAEVLSVETEQRLEERLAAHETKTGNQVVVLTIPSLQGEVIEAYALQVARAWQLGTAEHNDGVLLLVAVEDRALRIEVGYGLEGALPDAIAARIIRHEITPRFREGSFDTGVADGVDAILGALAGTYTPPEEVADKPPFWFGLLFLILPLIFGFMALISAGCERWFIFFFLIPFFFFSGISFGGSTGAFITVGLYVVLFLGLSFHPRIRAIQEEMRAASKSKKKVKVGPFTFSPGTSSSGGGSSFSGGGGSFGGGGASGSW